jgi:hypothetical protein
VVKHLEFKESDNVDCLGKPINRKRKSGDDGSPSMVPYPKGSVLVIKYDFVIGSHFASKVSDFRKSRNASRSYTKQT